MTIDEVIEYAEERVRSNSQYVKNYAQLADWLRELRLARMEIDLLKTLRDGFKADAQKYKAENAKLRELVLDMWHFTGAACKKYPRLFDPAAQGGQMVQLNMIDSFDQRMRELGLEES